MERLLLLTGASDNLGRWLTEAYPGFTPQTARFRDEIPPFDGWSPGWSPHRKPIRHLPDAISRPGLPRMDVPVAGETLSGAMALSAPARPATTAPQLPPSSQRCRHDQQDL
ncbi:MAG: hypothetical protein QM682_13770 [Paracoccus sp. (in: a-proteobacteria)]|uniref:hypothetical protein n=1 Tax=Paracoccus sp. TaxID=267 RepID=UPI0039E2E622